MIRRIVCGVLDVEAQRAEEERLAQGLPARLEDPATQSRIVTAMRTTVEVSPAPSTGTLSSPAAPGESSSST